MKILGHVMRTEGGMKNLILTAQSVGKERVTYFMGFSKKIVEQGLLEMAIIQNLLRAAMNRKISVPSSSMSRHSI